MTADPISQSNATSSIQPVNLSGELIAELVPDILAEVNNDKVYTWMNKAGLEFFGDEAIGKEASVYFIGEQSTYQTVNPLFTGTKDITYLESWQRRKDGEKRLLAWWCRALTDTEGNNIGALSTAHDITELHEYQEKVQYSEAQLYNALALARLGPWEYDVLKDQFTFNDTFYAMLHITAKEIGGYTLSSMDYAKRFVHPEDAPLVGMEVKKAIEASDPNFTSQVDHRILYADGGIGYITVRFFIVKDSSGKTIKTFGINQDITERKAKEEELKKAKEELQQKVSELEQFNKLMLNRELRMADLKKEIEELKNARSTS